MLLIERCLDLPVDILAPRGVLADEHDRARTARDVILSDAPYDVIDILAVDLSFKGIVGDDVVDIAECF